MPSLLDEIRQQPEHIRHVFMWTMVVITFSVVGFVWFRSTTKQFVALLNPEQAQEQALVQKNKPNPPSPFATIFDSLRGLQANISELLSGSKSSVNIKNDSTVPAEQQLPPQKLPLSN